MSINWNPLLLALCFHALLLNRPAAAESVFDHSHAGFSQVLKKHVRDGRVDYSALKADTNLLNLYLEDLAAVREEEFNGWMEKQRLAFLINLYNAATLKLIVDHYPVKSIKDIGGTIGSPWKQKVVRLFGQITTLEHVEHDLLRKHYREPRVHFVLVCAARGCPPLLAEAYAADRLDAQLEAQGHAFLAQSRKNNVDATNQVLSLSPIFKWFREDFERDGGTVENFVRPYFPAAVQATFAKGGLKVRYTDYDWSLNEAGPP